MDKVNNNEIYANYKNKIEKYISVKVKNIQDVEDLTAEVFLKIYRKIDGFDNEKASLSTWIYSITRNTVIDYFRTKKKDCLLDVEKISDGNFFESIEIEETLDELASALETLDERQRDLIILHYYDGKTLKEIANIFGMSYINAKIIHRNALHRLKSQLNWLI